MKIDELIDKIHREDEERAKSGGEEGSEDE
jgi:hypothetical protein